MTEKEREDLLWSLASRARAGEGSAGLTDRDLEKYREGSLDPEKEKEVELALATDRRARERLAEIAGIKLPGPPVELRERVLRRRPKALKGKRRPRWRRWWPGLVTAAVLALSLLPLLRPPALPEDLAFDLSAQGLSSVRGLDPAPASEEPLIEAYSETRIRVRLEPRGEARSGLRFRIYRRDGNALHRVVPEPPLSLEVSRGAALLEGPAAALAGATAGGFDFFFVVHRPGDAPASEIELGGIEPNLLLAAGQRRKVYPWKIRLLPAKSDEHSLEEEL